MYHSQVYDTVVARSQALRRDRHTQSSHHLSLYTVIATLFTLLSMLDGHPRDCRSVPLILQKDSFLQYHLTIEVRTPRRPPPRRRAPPSLQRAPAPAEQLREAGELCAPVVATGETRALRRAAGRYAPSRIIHLLWLRICL